MRKGSPVLLLMLFAPSTLANTGRKAINAVIVRKERRAPPSSSFSSDPIRSSTSALHTSRRKEVALSPSPSFFRNGRKGATPPQRISTSTASCLETLRGGSDDRREDYYGSVPDYDYRDADRGRGYDYGYYDDRGKAPTQERDDDYYGGDYYGGDYGRDYGDRDNGGYYDENRRYQEDYGYEDRGRRGSSRKPSSLSGMPTMIKTGNKKVGIILLGSGTALTFLGVMLFFNKTLMRLGNIAFVAGIPMMLGPGRTAGYFLQPKKARATGCLVAGMFLVFVGWPIFGILLEVFGLLNLFGNLFPLLMTVLRQLPIVGSLGKSGNNGGGSRRGQRARQNYDDRNYDDRYQDEERYY